MFSWDFVVTAYQLFGREPREPTGAAVVAALDGTGLLSAGALGGYPRSAHTAGEVRRAVDAGATIIGVNARNLHTLKVEPSTFARLAPLIPNGIVRIASQAYADRTM